jgi:hypothetical protein
MTHEDAGKYSAKHPAGTTCHPAITAAVEQKAENDRITCGAAHEIAARLDVAPMEVGKAIDLLEYRIVKCQMGLFGYSPEKKIVKPAGAVSRKLESRLRDAVHEGKVGCATCWEIARELGIGKMDVSAACEGLEIKISPCQLGAF